jgi:hypothetical protein
MSYEITPEIVIPGRAVAIVTEKQGKPRIRLQEQQTTTHFYRLLAAVLLLPKPKRELKQTHGALLLRRDSYSMTAINVDVSAKTSSGVVLRPTDLLVENADNKKQQVSVVERMGRIFRLWAAASGQSTPFAALVLRHKEAIGDAAANHKTIEDAADEIASALHTDADPLPLAERAMGLVPIITRPVTERTAAEEPLVSLFAEDDHRTPMEARVERVKQWRQLAVRGADGAKFRQSVRQVYGARCLFSGQRLPKTEVTETAGVDAAHILPWSRYDVNSVTNGICLDKLCHWGFDEGVVRLSFDRSASTYMVDVPGQMKAAAKKAGLDLEYFRRLAGPVPASRLPADRAHWPHPEYLEELNKFMFGSSA